MASANKEIQDALIRHQANLINLANKYSRDINAMISKTEEQLAGYLARTLPKVTPFVSTKKFQSQMKAMSKNISSIRRFGTRSISEKVRLSNIADKIGIEGAEVWYKQEMLELAQNEIKYIDDLIHNSVGIDFTTKQVPTQVTLNTVGLTPYSGGTIPQWFTSLKTNDLQRIMSTVQQGITQSLTPNQIIQGVFQTNIPATQRDAERLARTCTNGVANKSKMDYYTVNQDIIGGVVYTATLDSRTSEICMSLDSKRFQNIDEAPQPPLHPNCRSVLVPYVDKFGVVGNRVSVEGTNFRQEARNNYIKRWESKGLTNKEARTRWNNLQQGSINSLMNKERRAFANKIGRDVIGSVPPGVNYSDWLKTQPRSFVEDTLGKSKAKLFLDGDLPISKFVARDNSTRTLKEIYAIDSEAFKKAKVSKP